MVKNRKRAKKPTLCKYTKLEYVASTLKNEGLYASTIDSFNDPYECKGIKNPKDYIFVCLTRSTNSKLMWGHYANGHRGCSIRIELPDDYGFETCHLKEVNYESKVIDHSRMSTTEVLNSLYTKDKKWNAEKEHRAVANKSNPDKTLWEKVGNDIYFKVKIRGIDFGCVSDRDKHYLEALLAIKDFNNLHVLKKKGKMVGQIEVRKYMMESDRFRFILDKDFNYLKEIDRLLTKKRGK